MARRKPTSRFETLRQAVVDGTAEDVRQLLAEGAHPDEREEWDDPTPLMVAADRGRLEVVELLLGAGADVNVAVEGDLLDLPALPFLDALTDINNTAWQGWTAPVYAAAHGHQAIYDRLALRATPEVRAQAVSVWNGRQRYLDSLGEAARARFLESVAAQRKKPKKQAEREALLAEHPKLRRWIVQCAGCQRQGYKPNLPEAIDRQGTAARVRRLFQPLALTEYLCERCAARAEKKMRLAQEKMRQALASLPPHVKIWEPGKKPRKKS